MEETGERPYVTRDDDHTIREDLIDARQATYTAGINTLRDGLIVFVAPGLGLRVRLSRAGQLHVTRVGSYTKADGPTKPAPERARDVDARSPHERALGFLVERLEHGDEDAQFQAASIILSRAWPHVPPADEDDEGTAETDEAPPHGLGADVEDTGEVEEDVANIVAYLRFHGRAGRSRNFPLLRNAIRDVLLHVKRA